MITDTVSDLNTLSLRLKRFLSSREPQLFLPADTSCSAAPFDSLLSGICFEKGTGPILVTLESEQTLRVTGSIENLEVWCSHFTFPDGATEGDHRHPENVERAEYLALDTLSVIIEVQDAPENAL